MERPWMKRGSSHRWILDLNHCCSVCLSVSFAGCTPCTILSRVPALKQLASPPTAVHRSAPSPQSWHTGAEVHSPCSGRWVAQSAKNMFMVVARQSVATWSTPFALGLGFLCNHYMNPVMRYQKLPFAWQAEEVGGRTSRIQCEHLLRSSVALPVQHRWYKDQKFLNPITFYSSSFLQTSGNFSMHFEGLEISGVEFL